MIVTYSPEVMKQARELYAEQVASAGPAWVNAANNIRAGWSNAWVLAGILALAPLVALSDRNAEDMAA